MEERQKSTTIEDASRRAGFSISTGHRIEKELRNPPVKAEKPEKTKRGRKGAVTPEIKQEAVDILKSAPKVRSVAVFEEIRRRHPELPLGCRRSIERVCAAWRAEHGLAQEVIFRQTHEVGHRGLSDFTELKTNEVTIAGQDFPHLLYHFRMEFSGFEYASVVLGGESFVALSEGLQNALWALGGVPREHRTDSLSAAFRNLNADAEEDFTKRYDALCEHYGMDASRNNKSIAHENGSIESPHGHLKARIKDALHLRNSKDFESVEAYRAFIETIISRHNEKHAIKIDGERTVLGPLPGARSMDYEPYVVRVTRSSGFTLKKVFYSVPSRLINSKLSIRLYDDRLAVFLGGKHLFDLQRVRPSVQRHVVDYRHVIHSLRVKPMALYGLVYRDQLFPREAYRRTFYYLNERLSSRETCKIMVALLALAHDRCCEAELADELSADLDADRLPDVDRLQKRFAPPPECVPEIFVDLCPLDVYDCLLDTHCDGVEP